MSYVLVASPNASDPGGANAAYGVILSYYYEIGDTTTTGAPSPDDQGHRVVTSSTVYVPVDLTDDNHTVMGKIKDALIAKALAQTYTVDEADVYILGGVYH